MIWNWSQ